MNGRRTAWLPAAMMARLKATTFLVPVLSWLVPVVSSTFEVVGSHKVAVAAHGGHLAHLGHGGQAAGELADDLFLVAAQLVHVDLGRAEVDAQVGRQVLTPRPSRRHVQQRLGGDAAHVQAHAAQGGVALDQMTLRPRSAARKAAE
jgi:hypothetical protein